MTLFVMVNVTTEITFPGRTQLVLYSQPWVKSSVQRLSVTVPWRVADAPE